MGIIQVNICVIRKLLARKKLWALNFEMILSMTKPTKSPVRQQRLRSALAPAQSDQSVHCLHEKTLGPKLHTERTAKTLIKFGGCPGWSSLAKRSFVGFVGSNIFC